jgi:hypothetical protein
MHGILCLVKDKATWAFMNIYHGLSSPNSLTPINLSLVNRGFANHCVIHESNASTW